MAAATSESSIEDLLGPRSDQLGQLIHGLLARALALVAIVIGLLMFMFGGPAPRVVRECETGPIARKDVDDHALHEWREWWA